MAAHFSLHYLNFILMPITFLCRILLLLIIVVVLRRWQVSSKKKTRVTVVVLGDIGRSPRMQYHALSLSNHGFFVDLVGYTDSKPIRKISEKNTITLYGLSKETLSGYFPRVVGYFVKVVAQTVILSVKLLFKVPASEYILMQNPPCIPVMMVCWLFSVFNGSKLVIDWHNYGYTILSLTLGKNHRLVKIAHAYEKAFGQLAATEICVTKAMQKDLEDKWHIHAIVLYDRPPENFKPLCVEEKHDLFMKLKTEYKEFDSNDASTNSTFCSIEENGVVKSKKDYPAFIVSSTSWTEDEDFSLLLNALQMYDKTKSDRTDLPNLVCAVTGKGPMKQYYIDEIRKIEWKHVKIITPWLTAEDYPRLIGSADLGVCLHTSSSGLDLPMKVVDMFGCGVPVAAVGYECLHELVKDGINGIIFENEIELHKNFCELLSGFPRNQKMLTDMRKNLVSFRESTWETNWDENVLPLFRT